ncbi:MAG: NTP transferase domain-containing protein [Candidatus Kerfeldbacteria bacterium]|nr:NTP transferase domain-containing protein [Candidatus Kerfeldbacteria bacterium]
MKGIILAGGNGTRLSPLTRVTSKQLLPIYDQPMIYYPLHTLLQAGITEILIITAPDHAGDFLNFLGSGRDFKAKFTYEIQDKPMGLAQGLSIAETFVGDDSCTMILGDNIFEYNFTKDVQQFSAGAKIFVKPVSDPERFGVVVMNEHNQVINIEEKPTKPKSNLAQTGIYIYDQQVFDLIRALQPSARHELEITDLNNLYLAQGTLSAQLITGEWIDTGTFESLFKAAQFRRQQVRKS